MPDVLNTLYESIPIIFNILIPIAIAGAIGLIIAKITGKI